MQERSIRLAAWSWNIGTLTEKLVDVMCKKKIDITCLQDKWKDGKAKKLREWYKLPYSGPDGTSNGIRIMVRFKGQDGKYQ